MLYHYYSYLGVVYLSYFDFEWFSLVNSELFSCIGRKTFMFLLFVFGLFELSCCFCLHSAMLLPYLLQYLNHGCFLLIFGFSHRCSGFE